MLIPATHWLKGYHRQNLINDGLAAVVVTSALPPAATAACHGRLPASVLFLGLSCQLVLANLIGPNQGPTACKIATLSTACNQVNHLDQT